MLVRSSVIRTFAVAAVSSSALTPISAWAGPAACTEDPVGTLTCSGNQSAGVAATNPAIDTLQVIGLTQDITPLSGVPGIALESTGASITIVSDGSDDGPGGPFRIVTQNRWGIGGTIYTYVATDAALTTGSITIDNDRHIQAQGSGGYGIYASNLGAVTADDFGSVLTGDITIRNAGSISITGNNTYGILASGYAYVDVDDDGPAIATAGAVTVTTQDVSTEGAFSYGIAVGQSAQAFSDGPAEATTGAVDIAANGTITTLGANAHGIFLDSIAWANGYDSLSAITGDMTIESQDISTRGDDAAGIFVRAYALAGGSGTAATAMGGAVRIDANGSISTAGRQAFGIYVESATSVYYSQTASGSSGPVTINSNDVQTTGVEAHGIFVMSKAEGDGDPGSPGVTGAEVFINSAGNVSALGVDSRGILVANDLSGDGPAFYSNIAVNILSGSVTGGSGLGTGVGISNGANNTITNAGTISALSGNAIRTSAGNDSVANRGLIIGNVELGTGTNAFDNEADGIFRSAAIADLGGGTLTNDGLMTPGGSGTIQTTALTGDLEQNPGGTYAVDINGGTGNADLLAVSGGAELAGTVVAFAQNLSSGFSQFLIVSAAGGATDSGITATDTATVDYSVWFDPNGDDVYLTADVDFLGSGALNANQTSIAANLNAITAGGVPAGLSPVTNALTTLPTQGALAAALDQLSPEIYNYAKIETLFASEQFSSDLMSCRVNDGSGNAFIREGQCIWARARARFLDLDATSANIGADTTIGSFSAGGQVVLAPDWRLGFAAGYDNVSLDMPTGAKAEGDRANVGAVLKYNPGPFLFAAAVSGGWTDYDVARSMAFGGFAATADSDASIDYVAGRLHGAYLISQGDWYVKPQVDATVTSIDLGGLSESGGGGAALNVHGSSQSIFAISPAVEFGGQLPFSAAAVLRPFVRGGVTWRDGDNLGLDAGFAAAGPGNAGFTINTALDEVLADVSAGFDIINTDGAVLRLQYDGRFGEETSQNGASVRGSIPF